MSGDDCQGIVEYCSGLPAVRKDMPRKPLTSVSRIILLLGKGASPFSCFRRGRVWAEPRERVKGLAPCGFLGRSPKPSESLLVYESYNRLELILRNWNLP